MATEHPIWTTQDIALGAYVSMRAKNDEKLGIRLVKVDRQGSNSTYYFRDEKKQVDEVLTDFPGSESFEFDSQVRVLKSIGHSKNGGSGGSNRR